MAISPVFDEGQAFTTYHLIEQLTVIAIPGAITQHG